MKTNWYVITGGPSSGKTTVVKILEKIGYRIEYEAARAYIEQELGKGKTLEEIRQDEGLFQQKVYEWKHKVESTLPRDEVIILERAMPDTYAYNLFCKAKNSKELISFIKNSHYKKIFLFELLEYQKDHARTEDAKGAKKLEKLLHMTYKKFGFHLVRVPRMPLLERVNFVLKHL